MSQNKDFIIKESTISSIASAIKECVQTTNELSTEQMISIMDSLSKKDIVFVVNNDRNVNPSNNVVIAARGTGTISIYVNNNNEPSTMNLNEKENTEITFTKGEDAYSIYSITGAEGLIELDMHNQGIQALAFNSQIPLNKLIIFDNEIEKLDLSNCKELQFLHFHNNPICDDDKYKTNLYDCINSLPDRSEDAIGSILLYPWYGLEILVCYNNGELKKYPFGTWTDPVPSDGKTFQKSTFSSLTDVSKLMKKDKLFGVVSTDNNSNETITYYICNENKQLDNQSDLPKAINRHHGLRKELEKTTLPKNWMFGSAIQYSDEYESCLYYFRETGVQHIWETAEKGFGMKIGMPDTYNSNTAHYIDERNIMAAIDLKGFELNRDTTTSKNEIHGDITLNLISGRGDQGIYGLCPNAQLFLLHGSILNPEDGKNFNPTAYQESRLRLTTNCNSITSSTNRGGTEEPTDAANGIYKDSSTWQETRRILGEFGKDNIITQSTGNMGDSCNWTYEDVPGIYYGFGDFGTLENPASLENRSTTFFIGSIDQSRKISKFSNNSVCADFKYKDADGNIKEGIKKEPLKDYLVSYGDQIVSYYHNGTKFVKYAASGTSFSSPCCNCALALMRIIYSKILKAKGEGSCESFGKGSKFMDYVLKHWIDPLNDIMDFAAGAGVPDFLAKPITKERLVSNSHARFKVGEQIKFCGVNVGQQKVDQTFEFDHNYFAQLSKDTLVPIKQTTQLPTQINIHSNSSLDTPKNYNTNFNTSSIVSDIEKENQGATGPIGIPISGITKATNEIKLTNSDPSKKFTMQFRVSFNPNHLFSKNVLDGLSAEGGSVILNLCKFEYETKNFVMRMRVEYKYDKDGNFIFVSVQDYDQEDKIKKFKNCFSINLYAIRSSGGYWASHATLENGNSLQINQNTVGVFTITCDSKKMSFYYNGTLLKEIFPIYYDSAFGTLSNCAIFHDFFNGEYEYKDNVLFYNKCLSHEEIIKNTIYLINK